MGEFFKKFIIVILYTLIVIGLYLFITTNGTLKVILSEFSNINLVYFYLFIFIYIIGVISIIIADMSKSTEKKDLKKLKLKIPNINEYENKINNIEKEIKFRTPIFKCNDQRHYISDNKGNVLYKIKLIKTLPHVFNIYDANNKELGKVECDIFNNETNILFVNIGDKEFEIEKKISTTDFLHSEWILTKLPYKVTYKNNKTIIKEKNKEIAYIESYKKSIEGSLLNYDISINDKDKILEISIITLSLILGNPVYKRMILEGML